MQPVKVLASLCLAVVVGIFLIGPAFSSPLPVKELLSNQSLAKAPEKEAVEFPVLTEAGTPVASFRVENFQENWQVVEVGGELPGGRA